MKARLFWRLDERNLALVLAAFFLALAVPSALLIAQAYGQLKWQAFRSTQVAAEELAARIDSALAAVVASEDARSFGDYSFLVVEGSAAANFVQRSPLSAFPVVSAVPGVVGYFQVDSAGRLTTPLLPDSGAPAASYGITPADEAVRLERVARIREVLARNQLVRAVREVPVPLALDVRGAGREGAFGASSSAQAAFDRLAVEATPTRRGAAERNDATDAALEADSSRQAAALVPTAAPPAELRDDTRQKRLEETLVAEPASVSPEREAESVQPNADISVRTFAGEIDPTTLGVLDAEHLVLFRNVWRDGRRYVQGALIDRAAFVARAVEPPYRASNVAAVSRVAVAFQGRISDVLATDAAGYRAGAGELAGAVLLRTRLSPPLGAIELEFLVDGLPRAPGTGLLIWIAVTLTAVLCGGFLLMYRLGIGQLRLARQQQDFVSAVSHELKTPLTSIRMYGEILQAGWADEAKRRTYYDYIHSESERLSRLIENVLQLARLSRRSQRFDMRSFPVAELMEVVRSKVATQVERAGFTLAIRDETPAGTAVVVDADSIAQVFINLVDNALKFSAGAAVKAVEIAARRTGDGNVLFTVRDHGPGVPKAQMKKIFELFYRAESELTRETVGTGIGLALVRQLASAMGARVDVRNCEPGAEFRIEIACAGSAVTA